MSKNATYVFLDRDGVINKRLKGYVSSLDEFQFLPKAQKAIKLFHQNRFRVIVVSNQAGVGRGLVKKEELKRVTDSMVREVRASGGDILAVYYCPCRKEDHCSCRKPNPGLLLSAAQEFDIDLENSWMIGDELKDMQAGKAVGAKTILVDTPINRVPKKHRQKVDYGAKDLLAAYEIIKKNVQ